MKSYRAKGSLSVFAAISFMLIAQFLFIMIEAARYVEINKVTEIQSRSQVESIFAEYCRPLWEEYHILAADSSQDYIRVKLDEAVEKCSQISSGSFLSTNTSFIRTVLDNVEIVNLELITDASGQIFEAEVSSYMKNNITYEMARRIHDNYNALNSITDSSEYEDVSIDNALDVINNPQNYQDDTTSVNYSMQSTSTESSSSQSDSGQNDSTLSDVQELQGRGILALVLEEGTTVSDKSIDLSDVVSRRTLAQGINVERPQNGWLDKVLMEQYMEAYMSSYINPMESRALKYECEYIISGKASDEENLKGVVNKILAIREALNFMYIISDAAKMEEVTALATAIGGTTLNPAAILIIQSGLIAAWAYCESILDLRALLQGDKVPLIKSQNTWTSGLSGISALISGNAKAISSENGASYQNYLGFLLMSHSTEVLAYRALDMQEKTVKSIEGYENIKMDKLLCKVKINMDYKYNSVFADFVNLINRNISLFKVRQNAEYAYF